MVLSKLYLNYNAYFETNDNTYYEKALAEVEEVITEGGYSLAPNYLDNFKADISSSPEVIFSIPLDKKNASHNYLINKCLVVQVLQLTDMTVLHGMEVALYPQFIESYQEGDNRLGYTWAGGVQLTATEDASGEVIPQSGDPFLLPLMTGQVREF